MCSASSKELSDWFPSFERSQATLTTYNLHDHVCLQLRQQPVSRVLKVQKKTDVCTEVRPEMNTVPLASEFDLFLNLNRDYKHIL